MKLVSHAKIGVAMLEIPALISRRGAVDGDRARSRVGADGSRRISFEHVEGGRAREQREEGRADALLRLPTR